MNHKRYCLETLQAIAPKQYNNQQYDKQYNHLFDWLCGTSFISRFNKTLERRYALEIGRKFVKQACAQTTYAAEKIATNNGQQVE